MTAQVKFMFEYLKKHYASQLGLDESEKLATPGAGGKTDQASKEASVAVDIVQQVEPDEDDEDDDDDEEDDEKDYADFVPIKIGDKTKKRGSIIAERVVVDESWAPPVYKKDPEKTKFLADILPRLFFLAGLTRKELNVLVSAMRPIEFEAGSEIIKQGAEGDMFFIVESGVCDIEIENVGKVMEIPCPSKEDPTVLRRYFGELALLYDAPRAATVKARDAVKTWGLDRKTFKSILQDTASKQRLLYGDFLKQVPLFHNIGKTEIEKEKFINTLCDSLKGVDYAAGDIVIKEGTPGNDFFIIESGEAECTQLVGGCEVPVCPVLKDGSFFGELSLLKDAPRAATVKALTPLSVVKIDRATFKRMIGNLGEIRKDYQHATA